MLSDYWYAFQLELFPRLESKFGPMGERYELFVVVLELVRVEALLFDLPEPDFYLPFAKTPSTLPVLLNQDELTRLFSAATNRKHRALLITAYAAGLRASEFGRLQISDIDSQRMLLRVEQGKGNKDRYAPLSPRLLEELREYWRAGTAGEL